MATSAADRETILKAIESWPLEDQVTLAQDILRHARSRDLAPRRLSSREMHGSAAGEQPPPSDDDVAQWLDDHRLTKYG
jgi:hypothetical protein